MANGWNTDIPCSSVVRGVDQEASGSSRLAATSPRRLSAILSAAVFTECRTRDGRSGRWCRRARKPHSVTETVTVHCRFHPLAGARAAALEHRSHRGEPIAVVADSEGRRYDFPPWMTAREAAQRGFGSVPGFLPWSWPTFAISLRHSLPSRRHRRGEKAMRYAERERAQRILRFEPLARVRLPQDVRQEAVAVIAAVMGEAGRVANEGGRDE